MKQSQGSEYTRQEAGSSQKLPKVIDKKAKREISKLAFVAQAVTSTAAVMNSIK